MVTYEGSRINASSLSDVKNISISTHMFWKKSATISTFQYNSAENLFPFSPVLANITGQWMSGKLQVSVYIIIRGFFFFSAFTM